MVRICSFDVFDTCLARRVASPSDVFRDVAQKVFNERGIAVSRHGVEDFVAARIVAERSARQQNLLEDIGLDEIWKNLFQELGWPFDATFPRHELEAEEELLVPILSIRNRVQSARREGCRIIFASDMYLPSEFIERQLRKHGFAEAGDGMYVSGNVGKTKASGSLFKHILTTGKCACVSDAACW